MSQTWDHVRHFMERPERNVAKMKRIRESLESSREIRSAAQILINNWRRGVLGKGCWFPSPGGQGSPPVELQGSCEEVASLNKAESGREFRPGTHGEETICGWIKEKRVQAVCLETDDGDAVLSSLAIAFCCCDPSYCLCVNVKPQQMVQPVCWHNVASFPWIPHPRPIHSFPWCFLHEAFPAGTAYLIADALQKLTDQKDFQAPLMLILRIPAMIFALLCLCWISQELSQMQGWGGVWMWMAEWGLSWGTYGKGKVKEWDCSRKGRLRWGRDLEPELPVLW